MNPISAPCLTAVNRPFSALWVALALLFAAPVYSAPVFIPTTISPPPVTDATKTVVQVPSAARRIITLAPSLAELAADVLGTELDRIVGVTEYTDYPPKLSRVKSVGPYHRFNIEEVVALKPDLVLGTTDGNSRDQIARLRELGIPVVVVETGTFEEIADSIELVGRALGKPDVGKGLVVRLRAGVGEFKRRAESRTEKRNVLLQIGDDPLIIAGGQTFLDEALTIVGAKNAFGSLPARYPRPTAEEVIVKDPDVILVLALGKDLRPFQAMGQKWGRFPRLKAVTNKRVRVLQGDTVLRPSLRLLEGLAHLEKAIWP